MDRPSGVRLSFVSRAPRIWSRRIASSRARASGRSNQLNSRTFGTPLELSDKNTRAVFGDYISIYDIQRAVTDGATVKIYYESRLAKLDVNQAEIDALRARGVIGGRMNKVGALRERHLSGDVEVDALHAVVTNQLLETLEGDVAPDGGDVRECISDPKLLGADLIEHTVAAGTDRLRP